MHLIKQQSLAISVKKIILSLFLMSSLFSITHAQNIVAIDDDFGASSVVDGEQGGVAGNILANDIVNATTPTSSSVTIQLLTNGNLAGAIITPNGDVIIPKGTPGALNPTVTDPYRTFTLTYRICEVGNTSNCDDASITVYVDGDRDSDGTPDSLDKCDGFDDTLDNDGDGIPDACDDDDDNDGLLDTEEGCSPITFNTRRRIYFADGTIDRTAPTDVNLEYSTIEDYTTRIGGDAPPVDRLFLNGFDPIDGQVKMVLNLTTPYKLTVNKVITFRAYLFNNRRDDSGDYDLPIKLTLGTVASTILPIDQVLTVQQTNDLDDGKWIELEYKLQVEGDGNKEIQITSITQEIEVNSAGVYSNFNVSDSEVLGIIPLELVSDIQQENCTRDSDGDGIIDAFDEDDTSNCVIPNAFTPNNDNVNDTFEICAVKNAPDFEIEIYNRWGNKVYEYQNQGRQNPIWWDGFSTGRLTFNSSKPVPVGTYFYIIKFNDGTRSPVNGWVYLSR